MHESIERQHSESARRATRRARASLVVACGLHSALIVAMWRHHPAAPAEGVESADDTVVDLEINVPPEVVPPPEEIPVEPTTPPRVPPEATAARESSTPRAATTGGGDGTANAEPAPPAPSSSASGGWSFPPTARGPVNLGFGTPRVPDKLPPGAIPKVDIPADERPSTSGGLLEALDVGMGRGNPVKVAVENAARGTDAPERGTAVFDVTVGVEGGVQISLVSASANYDGWNQLIESIRRHLAKKNVRIPPNSKGLHVVVEVEAHEQLPDGKSPGSLGFGESRGGGFSLPSVENIGARATRIVSSRIKRETRL